MVETEFTVTENKTLCPGTHMLTLKADAFEEVLCGQFISINIPGHAEMLLRRPFAVCGWDREQKTVSLCFKAAGKGTEALSGALPGERLSGIFPLGNGFRLEKGHKKIALVGGGAGIFPLFAVNKSYPDREYYSFLGYRDKETAVLTGGFGAFSKGLYISSEDGSIGEKGFVTDLLKKNMETIKPDIVLSCGPAGMLRALKGVMALYPQIPAYVSLEERMGCGIGACLVCACKIQGNDGVHNKRVCKDGPVFNISEAVL